VNDPDLIALWLTARLALITTLVLLVVATPLAWWLARSRSAARIVIEPLVALPLILPPTVIGFYLLIAFAPDGPIGALYGQLTGERLAFTFTGLVLGSVVYSLPFFVQPLQVAFESIEDSILEAAASLGAAPLDRFFTVAVPLARRGFVTAGALAFAHTIGEFGIVLMIGGSIPGETRVLSITIFEHVETLQYAKAHRLSVGLLGFSFLLLLGIYAFNRRLSMRTLG
jgi:molybdate transport system permease protein